jgi:hypothetical protein
MNNNNVLSFPVSSPMRGNGKREGNESGNGLVKEAISNGKIGNEWETDFRPVMETNGSKPSVSFPVTSVL